MKSEMNWLVKLSVDCRQTEAATEVTSFFFHLTGLTKEITGFRTVAFQLVSEPLLKWVAFTDSSSSDLRGFGSFCFCHQSKLGKILQVDSQCWSLPFDESHYRTRHIFVLCQTKDSH